MTKKGIGLISAYALVMVVLFTATFAGEWNPSNYSYTLNEDTLTIEEGLWNKEQVEIEREGNINEILMFQVAVSEERQQWRLDLGVIAVLLPLLMFITAPGQRPFRKYLPFKWYTTVVLAILVIYTAWSIPAHLSSIDDIQRYVSLLTSS
ncbi:MULTISPECIES: hypothetical protein [Halobacillus]|uniref:hypothetical protein n=1 Tax=Halobacillus TaxID=45667 RepID=UPI001CD3753F|nr:MULTISPECIES: hypothetical protein [Halobacillus]MCA1020878.1 hypothetical protein [Halobacillus litoralis]